MTRDEWRTTFGGNLVDLINEVGISQNQLAKDSSISSSSISGYINKWSAPSVIAIVNMAYALNVSVDELIDFGEGIDD